jgi:tetratricopeptide (TPR) repeat protein
VTFTERTNQDLEGFGFAGEFLLNNGHDVVAVKANDDRWHQDLPCNAFDSIRAVSSAYSGCVTYGSSMGGYAAIYYAKALDADRVLALSPPYDIATDWDHRWRMDLDRIDGFKTLEADDVSERCLYHLVYDPHDLDGRHAQIYDKMIGGRQIRHLRTPHAGHPSGIMLSQTHELKEIALRVIAGHPPPAPNRQRRKTSSHTYLLHLAAHCKTRNKLPWAAEIIARAVATNPTDPVYHCRQSEILRMLGRTDEAIAAARSAVALNSSRADGLMVWFRHQLSSTLEDKGLLDQALSEIREAITLQPNAGHLILQKERIQSALVAMNAFQ